MQNNDEIIMKKIKDVKSVELILDHINKQTYNFYVIFLHYFDHVVVYVALMTRKHVQLPCKAMRAPWS